MSDKTQMVTFPRELSDDLAELIAEKARVCGGGAFEIWEAICEQFGQPAPAAVADERIKYEAWAKENGISTTRTPQALGFANGQRRAAGDYIMIESLCSHAAWMARAKLNGVAP